MRYVPSRKYAWAGIVVMAASLAAAWGGRNWPAMWAAGLALMAASIILIPLGLRPSVEARDRYLRIGRRAVAWHEIVDIRRAVWRSVVLVRLATSRGRRFTLIFTGDPNTASSLLRQICRSAATATIDGRPYAEFWGELPAPPPVKSATQPPYRLLRHEDEAEVERLYQRLKTVGSLDSTRSNDEA